MKLADHIINCHTSTSTTSTWKAHGQLIHTKPTHSRVHSLHRALTFKHPWHTHAISCMHPTQNLIIRRVMS